MTSFNDDAEGQVGMRPASGHAPSELDDLGADTLDELLGRVERGEMSAQEFERATSDDVVYEVDGAVFTKVKTIRVGPKTRMNLPAIADFTGRPQLTPDDGADSFQEGDDDADETMSRLCRPAQIG